jgi:uncharacterized protein (DUF885 family)
METTPTRVLVTLSLALSCALGALAAPPVPAGDLGAAARQLERFPATRGKASSSARLRRFFDLYWATLLREDPDYALYVGAGGLSDRWPDGSPAAQALVRKISRLERTALASIDRARLAAADQVDYDLLRRRLDLEIEAERFEPLGEKLAIGPMSGVDLNLLQLAGYRPPRDRREVEALLARFAGFPAMVDRTLERLDQGLAAGITPPRITLRDVPARIAGLLDGDPAKGPLLAPFQALPDSIPAAEGARLRAEAARLYAERLAPALRKLHDYLVQTYVPKARESIAVSDLPDGRALYAYQLRYSTSTDLTPEAIHRLGLAEVARIRREMEAAMAAAGFTGSFAEFFQFLRTDPRFFYDRPEELVAAYRDIVKRIDPGLIRLFGRLPRLPYGVKALDETSAKSAPAGYYSNGSLAAGTPGWFLVNTTDLKARPKWGMEALALHEAVPGHHLQYSLVEELGELPDWRKWDVYPAFSEGWGLYAESLGEDLGLYQDPYSKFGRLTNEVWRAIRLVVDTGIHTMGWSRQRAIDYYLANAAKTPHEIEAEVDRIIVQPGTVPAYKVGELKIRELRNYAKRELGERFDIRAFHDQLLGHGQLPLDLLEKSMKGWVAEKKGGGGKRRG